MRQGCDGGPAGARRIDDQLPPRTDPVAHLSECGGGYVGAEEIELVLLSVEGAMTDQDEHEIVLGSGLLRDRPQRFGQVCPGGIGSGEGDHVGCGARGSQYPVQIGRERIEPLLVIGLSSQTRNGHEVGIRASRRRRHAGGDTENSKEQRAGRFRESHTMPHFLRSSHSPHRRHIRRRNTAGMFHRSLSC